MELLLLGLVSKDVIVKASNLSITDFHICEELEKRLNKNMKIKLRNDAKCAALAEKEYGVLKQYNNCLFLGLGTGIGGAAFIDGKLLETTKYSGYEFGHMIIEKGGRLCSCGKKGCFEKYGSIKALKTEIVNVIGENEDITGKYFRENILTLNNPIIEEEIEKWLNYLKIGIGNLIDIFEPEAICFGGSFTHYEENKLLERLIEKMNETDSTFTTSKRPDMMFAKFKNDAGVIGATL